MQAPPLVLNSGLTRQEFIATSRKGLCEVNRPVAGGTFSSLTGTEAIWASSKLGAVAMANAASANAADSPIDFSLMITKRLSSANFLKRSYES